MKLFIDSTKRLIRQVFIFDKLGDEVTSIEGDQELLVLIDQALKKAGVDLKDLTSIEAKMVGESRVGVNIGAAAANALNYALGLKGLEDLEYPSSETESFK